MNIAGGIAAWLLAFVFFWVKLEWMGFLFVLVGVIVLLYEPAKDSAKKTWDDVKKTPAFYPQDAFEGYVKGVSKQAAERVVRIPQTGTDYASWFHKTPQIAKNFFAEIEKLFK